MSKNTLLPKTIMSSDNLTNISSNSEKSTSSTILIVDPSTFEGTERRYYEFALDFFYNKCLPTEVEMMISIINNKTPISISWIEWFVMKYTTIFRVSYVVNNRYCNEEKIDVNISYSSQIDSFGKDNFDPCRRKKKFYFHYGESKILTTIAQLIFFRWCFHYEIIQYMLKNAEEIAKNKPVVLKHFSIKLKEKIALRDEMSVLSDSRSSSDGFAKMMLDSDRSTNSGASSGTEKSKFIYEI